MLYLLIALQVADIITTIIALRGPAHEANPIVAWFIAKIGLVPGLIVTKGLAIAFFWYFQAQIPEVVFMLLCAFYVYIIYHNVQTIQKGRAK